MGDTSLRRLVSIAVLALAATSPSGDLRARQMAEPPALGRLRAYLETYEPQLGEFIAEERFDQREKYGIHDMRRMLVSEIGFLRLPGNLEWLGQRRVLTMDGRAVRTSFGSLAEEQMKRPDIARALSIASENARFNLGRPRSINVPTLPLDLLGRRSAFALSVESTGTRRIDGRTADTIELRERGPAALVGSGPGVFAPVTIEAAVDPVTGAVLNARVDLRLPDVNATHRIEVDFAPDTSLGLLVPAELRETFLTVRGTARYTNYRRFRTGARIIPPPVE